MTRKKAKVQGAVGGMLSRHRQGAGTAFSFLKGRAKACHRNAEFPLLRVADK